MNGVRTVDLHDALRGATARLAAAGVASPRVDAEALAAFVLGVSRSRLSLERTASEAALARFEALVARREAREPLQHLTGTAPFRRLDLAVGPGVFVPRPETEVLAGWAVEELRERRRDGVLTPLVVDLCTGSGALAIAIATELPGARVHAVEIEPAAYDYAKRNAEGTGVVVHLSDAATVLRTFDAAVDLVVANPPYIPDGGEVEPEVSGYDPPQALWGGPDGLDVVRVVVCAAARLLHPGGALGIEHADTQGTLVPELLADDGPWADVEDHEDVLGRPRFTTAVRARVPR